MKQVMRYYLALVVVLSVLLTGCEGENASTVQIAADQQTSARILPLTALSSISVSPPPAIGSQELAFEMQELLALRSTLTDDQQQAITRWNGNNVVQWNEMARQFVAQHQMDPLEASRLYMVLSVAQHEALQQARDSQRQYDRHMPDAAETGLQPLAALNPAGSYPSEHAALAGASAVVLAAFFPGVAGQIDAMRAEAQESRLWAATNCRSDVTAGDALGRDIATALVNQSQAERNALPVWTEPLPRGPDKWKVNPDTANPPERPEWRLLMPRLMDRADQFRAPPPPTAGSPAFDEALAEVRSISDHRTEEQVRIATFWGDGKGTATPPGHWNAIASALITDHHLSDDEAAERMMYVNLALYDAGIAAWDTKYTYWLLRPRQADPAIKVVLKRTPDHPSYVSGHATFSGAAATVLAGMFPEAAERLSDQAAEASLSRVYAGIHYRFDGTAGLAIGRSVGALALDRWKAHQQ